MSPLTPLSWLYGLGVLLRNAAFDAGMVGASRVGVPVVSVGNITAGGTGKTPLVEFIARYIMSTGHRPAIVSRGYGRSSHGVRIVSDGESVLMDAGTGGDEPVQMARKLKGVPVVVGERRVDAAKEAIQRFHPDMLVLDDGFQHRYLHRDVDIVVVEASNTADLLLPAGRRREHLSSLRRASIVAFSRVETPADVQEARDAIGSWYQGPVAGFTYGIHAFIDARNGQPTTGVDATPVIAFSGIGNHKAFLKTISAAGVDVVADVRYRDHHRYSSGDLEYLVSQAQRHSVSVAMTTEKDAVRLSSSQRAWLTERLQLIYPDIGVRFVVGEGIIKQSMDTYRVR